MTIHTQVLESRLAQLLPQAQQVGGVSADLRGELLRALRQLEELDAQLEPGDQAQAAAIDDDLVRVYRRAARLAAAMPARPVADAAQDVLRIGLMLGRSLDGALVREVAQQVASRPVFAPPVGAQHGAALLEAVFAAIALVAANAARAEPPRAGVAA